MGLDSIYIGPFYSKGLGVWAYALKLSGLITCGTIQGVIKGEGVEITNPNKIFSGVKGLYLGGSMLFSEGCLSIYCFIWAFLSVRSFCS